MLCATAAPLGFASPLGLHQPAPSLPRSTLPRLQDLAVASEDPPDFHFETDQESEDGVPFHAAPIMDAPLVAHDLVSSLISSGEEPGKALADVILATQVPDMTTILPDMTVGEAPPPEFFFEDDVPAVPLVMPIDPLTGELPPGVELPVALPVHDLGAGTSVVEFELPAHADDAAVAVAAAAAASDPANTMPELPTLKQLALFCLPTLGIWLSSPLLSLIDTSVVGLTCATHHLAALAPSTKLCDYVAFFCSVMGAATTNLAADAFAHGDPTKAKRVIGGSLTISIGVGIIVAAVLGVLARPLMAAMLGASAAANPAMWTAASQYTTIRALGYPAALMTMVLQSAFIATKDSRSPLLAVPLVAAVNLVADLCLVPSMGAAGAAWATTLALYTNAAVLLGMWARKARTVASRPVPVLAWPTKAETKALLAFAAPMMVALISRVAMGLSITLSAVALGTTALAANQIVESLYWLFCPFGEAVSLCMQAYLPPLLLHGRSLARRLQGQAFRAALGLGGLAAMLGVVLPMGLPGLFTSSVAVTSTMAAAAPMLGFTLVSYVLFCATEGMLIARKQLRFLAMAHCANAVLFAGALRAVVARPLCGLQHVWALFAVMNLFRLSTFLTRLRSDDIEHLVKRKEEAALPAGGRNSPRWQRALRALSFRVDALRHHQREKLAVMVPPVELIAPHLLGDDMGHDAN